MKRYTAVGVAFLLVAAVLVLGACSRSPAPDGELVVYSTRSEHFVQPLLDDFQEETGIRVAPLFAGEAVINLIEEERNNVQADIIIANDAGALEYLRRQGLLKPHETRGIENIPGAYRAQDNSWFGLSARIRVLMYNRDLVQEEELPQQVEELAHPRWKETFAITRGGNPSLIAHVSALRHTWGDQKTMDWLQGLQENAGAILRGHGEIRRAVGAGEFAFGLVNDYYFRQQLAEPTDNNVGVVYPDQGEEDMGVVVNAAGVGLIRDGPNQEAAGDFLEWLLEPDNHREFARTSLEVPLNPQLDPPQGAPALDELRLHDMPLGQLGEYWTDSHRLIEESGLDLELR